MFSCRKGISVIVENRRKGCSGSVEVAVTRNLFEAGPKFSEIAMQPVVRLRFVSGRDERAPDIGLYQSTGEALPVGSSLV